MCLYIGHRNNVLGLFVMLVTATNIGFSVTRVLPGVLPCIPAL